MDAFSLTLRWSATEATRPYARPFGATCSAGGVSGMIAVSGRDLVYLRHFQDALLRLGGVALPTHAIARGEDAQHAWLDLVSQELPVVTDVSLRPVSVFDEQEGRFFLIEATLPGRPATARLPSESLLAYQEFQAAIAHQTGCLFRHRDLERLADIRETDAAFEDWWQGRLVPADPEEAVFPGWPYPAR